MKLNGTKSETGIYVGHIIKLFIQRNIYVECGLRLAHLITQAAENVKFPKILIISEMKIDHTKI